MQMLISIAFSPLSASRPQMLFKILKDTPIRVWTVVMQGVVALLKEFYGVCVCYILPSLVESLSLLVCREILLAVGRNVLFYMPNAQYVIDTMSFLCKHVRKRRRQSSITVRYYGYYMANSDNRRGALEPPSPTHNHCSSLLS